MTKKRIITFTSLLISFAALFGLWAYAYNRTNSSPIRPMEDDFKLQVSIFPTAKYIEF